MATADPLGLVYQGQDNTGAAYILGANTNVKPIDEFLHQQQLRYLRKKAAEDALAKQKAAVHKDLDPGQYKAWDRDLSAMQTLRDDYTKKAVDIEQNYGKDKNEDAVKYQQMLDQKERMFHSAAASSADEQTYNTWDKLLVTEPDKFSPDARQTLEDWAKKPFGERTGTQPNIQPAKADWASAYMKTPEPGTKTSSYEVPSTKNPGFTTLNEETALDKEAAVKKFDAWFDGSGDQRAKVQMLESAHDIIAGNPQLAAMYAQSSPDDQQKILREAAKQMAVALDDSRVNKSKKQSLQPIPQGRADESTKDMQEITPTSNYPVGASTQLLTGQTAAGVDAKKGEAVVSYRQSTSSKGSSAPVTINASKAYNFNTEVPLHTVPNKAINMNTGKEEIVTGGKDYKVQGTYQLPYVMNEGKMILVRPEIEKQYPKGIKKGWFAVGLQDAGTADGQKVWEPRAIPFTSEMKKQLEERPKGKVMFKDFDDSELWDAAPAKPAATAKELSGTQSQLDAAAKNKGMTTEAYMALLKKQGYIIKVK